MYDRPHQSARLEYARDLFKQHLGRRKMFRATLSTNRSDYVTLVSGEIVRSIWRSWKAHNWIYQVDGELWAVTHPADRLKWD